MNGKAQISHAGIEHPGAGHPPLPHEHGAWMMLYTPLLIALIAFQPAPVASSFLLVVAITSAFLAQNAAGILMRRRHAQGTVFWLVIYTVLFAVAASLLLLVYGLVDLLWIGLPGLVLFGRQAYLSRFSHKRVDHSYLSEIFTVGVLALSAPAAYLVARGELDRVAWQVWVACALYFSSSVFYVKMLVAAARLKETLNWTSRWRVGRESLVYHLLLAGLLVALQLQASGGSARLVAVAYAPAVFRALGGWALLANRIGSMKRVGVLEILYAVWFAGALVAALAAKH